MHDDYKDQHFTAISIGLTSIEHCWDWHLEYQQFFPTLYDQDYQIYYEFLYYNVLLDENMTIKTMQMIYEDDLMRSDLEGLISNMILIDHQQAAHTDNTTTGYTIECTIRSQESLNPASLLLNWNRDGSSSFETLPLQHQGGNSYSAVIPPGAIGETVHYYVHAENIAGKSANSPWTAPANLYSFNIITDTSPPVLTHEPVTRWPADKWSPVIETVVTDQMPVTVELQWDVNGTGNPSVYLVQNHEGVWTGTFSDGVVAGDVVTYRLVAKDSSVSQNTATLPESGFFTMTIPGSCPVAVLDPDPNHSSGPVIRDLLGNLSLEVDYYDHIPGNFEMYHTLFTCLGVYPENHVLTLYEKEGFFYFVGQGGNMYLEGGDAWGDCVQGVLHQQFGITSHESLENGLGGVKGYKDTLGHELQLNYQGENTNIDHLLGYPFCTTEIGTLSAIIPINHTVSIANETDTYKTIGTSFELAGLVDGAGLNTRQELLHRYAGFFDLTDPPVTPTPSPTSPPSPTPTALPCETLGATIFMPAHTFVAGDPCSCSVELCNPDSMIYNQIPFFVILECGETYFFWPDFSPFNYEVIDLNPGVQTFSVLPLFNWPEGAGSASAIWYSAMTNPEINELFGELDTWEFNWQ